MSLLQQDATLVGSTTDHQHNKIRVAEKRTVSVSICSLSWIDKWVGLPKDDGSGPPDYVGRESIMARDESTPYRFANILEATIEFDKTDPSRTVRPSFTAQSGGYGNPSFLDIPSKQFNTIQERPVIAEDSVRFTQTVGFQTESPEVIAERIGGASGDPVGRAGARNVAHQLLGLPPIWTKLDLTIYFNGGNDGGHILAYSLFPSVTWYVQQPHYWKTHQYQKVDTVYDACGYKGSDDPNYVQWGRDYYYRWDEKGWGDIAPNPRGPTNGNPWGASKNPAEGSW